MLDEKEVSLLDILKQKYAQFLSQRDQAQANFQQLVGATFACECMIKQHEETPKAEDDHGKIINETKGCST